jgi:sensor histidine kinase YesM
MITLEQVEKLTQVTGVSYAEAKQALEETQGDMLEAVLLLERQGKVKRPENDGFTSSKQQSTQQKPKSENQSFAKFVSWLKHVLHLGNINDFVIYRETTDTLAIPLTIFVILLIVAFWVVFPLMIIGLFFNYRYKFAGPSFKDDKVNQTLESISNATVKTGETIRDVVRDMSKDKKKEDQSDQDSAN